VSWEANISLGHLFTISELSHDFVVEWTPVGAET
jgi:hypothetical protein